MTAAKPKPAPERDPRDETILSLQARLATAENELAAANEAGGQWRDAHNALEKRLTKAEEEYRFLRDTNLALEKRLERAKGYIDRVLEAEDVAEPPQMIPQPVSPHPKGPAVEEIVMPTRAGDRPGYAGTYIGGHHSARRY